MPLKAVKNLIDGKLLTVIIALITFGLIMVFSASYPEYGFRKIIMQTLYTGIAIFISAVFIFEVKNFNLDFLFKHSKALYLITLLLLILVFLPIDGNTVNGSTRWLSFKYFKIQPSEIAKLAIILSMAKMMAQHAIHDIKGTWNTLFVAAFFAIALMLEPDFGATVLIIGTAFIMIFVAGTKLRYLFYLVLVAIFLVSIFLYFNENRMYRIIAFFTGDDKSNVQSGAAIIGIVRGGLLGVGIGNSLQKLGALPEPFNDMIFAIIGEELGVLGMLFLLFSYFFIFFKGFKISQTAIALGYRFESYVAFGISILLAIQVSINLLMNLGLFPPKGITLPLISYGGSSMLITIFMLAILLKIDMNIKQRKYAR